MHGRRYPKGSFGGGTKNITDSTMREYLIGDLVILTEGYMSGALEVDNREDKTYFLNY